jgi:DNA repair exonuclease SbcCD ATPase subunit
MKLSIEGLFSYQEKSSLWLDKPGLILVDGEVDNDNDSSNGAGKTSIIDAICLCLFKCTTRGTENDDVVNDEMDSGWAALTFIAGQESYQAQYERDKKLRKTIWKIYHNQEGRLIDISGRGQAETREIIQSIIGVDYNTFSNSVLFGQGLVSLFLAKGEGDASRKRLFTQILDLDVLDGALQETRDSIKEIEKRQTALEQERKTLEDKIGLEPAIKMEHGVIQAQIGSINKQIASINENIKALEKVAALLEKQTSIADKVVAAEEAVKDIEERESAEETSRSQRQANCDQEIKTAECQLEEIEKGSADLEGVEELLNKVEEGEKAKITFEAKSRELNHTVAVAKSEIKQKRKTIADIKEMESQLDNCDGKDNCPYCGQSLDDDSRKRVHQKVEMEVAEIEGQIDDLNFEVETAEKSLEDLHKEYAYLSDLLQNGKARVDLTNRQQKIKTAIESRGVWEEQIKRLKKSKESIDAECKANIDSLETKKKSAQEELDKSNKELESINIELKGAYIPESSKEQLESDLRSCTKERDRQNIALGMKTQVLGEIENAKMARVEVVKSLGEIDHSLKHERFIEEMFGADGIKSLIIMSVTPRLTDLANRYLAELSDRPISVDFVTSYEGKTKTIEDFKILVTRGLKTSDIKSFSGGERKTIEFAVHFAISDIVREKSGCNISTLFLDEPFDSLDESKINRCVRLLRSLNEQFPTIFAMCHIAYAKEQFDRVITVKNVGGCSTIINGE